MQLCHCRDGAVAEVTRIRLCMLERMHVAPMLGLKCEADCLRTTGRFAFRVSLLLPISSIVGASRYLVSTSGGDHPASQEESTLISTSCEIWFPLRAGITCMALYRHDGQCQYLSGIPKRTLCVRRQIRQALIF